MTELEQNLQMEVIELLSEVRAQHSQIKELEDELKKLKKDYTFKEKVRGVVPRGCLID